MRLIFFRRTNGYCLNIFNASQLGLPVGCSTEGIHVRGEYHQGTCQYSEHWWKLFVECWSFKEWNYSPNSGRSFEANGTFPAGEWRSDLCKSSVDIPDGLLPQEGCMVSRWGFRNPFNSKFIFILKVHYEKEP